MKPVEMAEEQRNKRPLTPSGESGGSSKRTMSLSASPSSAVSGVIVKQEPMEAEVAVGGRGSRARAAAAEQTSPAVALRRVNVSVALDRIHCNVADCCRPLKPPIFKCEAGHRLCSICRIGGRCPRCDRATAFVHCGGDLDADIGDLRVPCPFEEYGCGSSVVYHDAAAHRDACAYAPCPCAAPGCAFAASPPMLRDHLAAEHGWRVDTVPGYGRVLALTVPTSERHRLLAVEGDARRLFVLSVSSFGGAVVSLRCVRSAGAAEAGPRYSCAMWTEAPAAPGMPASKGRRLLMEADVASCEVPGGAAMEEGMVLYVPTPMLRGPSKEINLRLRIDVIVIDPAASSPGA